MDLPSRNCDGPLAGYGKAAALWPPPRELSFSRVIQSFSETAGTSGTEGLFAISISRAAISGDRSVSGQTRLVPIFPRPQYGPAAGRTGSCWHLDKIRGYPR